MTWIQSEFEQFRTPSRQPPGWPTQLQLTLLTFPPTASSPETDGLCSSSFPLARIPVLVQN